jgi:slime mold repeat-containing protein
MRKLPAVRPHLALVLLFPILVLGFNVTRALAETALPEFACPSCDDFNPCTIDSCDTSTGTCRHAPRSCEDGNPCTVDSCRFSINNPKVFTCQNSNVPNGTICSDGNSCTTGDACLLTSGLFSQCTGELQAAGTGCDDGNSCTGSDTCDTSGQCLGIPGSSGSSCDDGSLCTSQDTCVLSDGSLVCQGAPKSCGDADLCTQDVCDPATGQCGHPPVNCEDGNICTDDSCDAATGACVRGFRTMACTYGDPCITGQVCSGGNCIGGTPVDCDDQISCTIDTCQRSTGTCTHTPYDILCGSVNRCAIWSCLPGAGGGCFNRIEDYSPAECDLNPCTTDICVGGNCIASFGGTKPCNDSDPCTINDRCSNGPCLGTPRCDDGNPCTYDLCDRATLACGHANRTGGCSDGDSCTVGDTCNNGICQGGTTGLSCDDGDPCTADSCSASGTECVHTNACDDGNVCTTDSCDPTSGACAHTNNTEPCNDGDLCTVGDLCSNGTCLRGQFKCGPVNDCEGWCSAGHCYYSDGPCVDDGNPCTRDICHILDACIHPPVTTHATCGVGVCQKTVNSCANGVPQECLPGTPAAEVCNGLDDDCDGSVDEGADIACDDNNPCTADACSGISGCGHTPADDGTSCSDGNPCTGPDTCKYGICMTGPPLPGDPAAEVCNGRDDDCDGLVDEGTDGFCADSNPCTTDTCSGISGCGHTPADDGTSCSDGNPCTGPDACKSGNCTGDPTAEVCNGWDDDCDGLVDENRVRSECIINPSTLNLDSQGGVFSLTCKLFDVCDPDNPTSISGSTVTQVYVSRADSADDPGDDVTLPDPFTLDCPDPTQGSLFERGIVENLATRDISHANVTFKFDQPSDGDCSTLDGDRADLAARLVAIPNNTSATVCISGKADGADFQACTLMLVRNRGLRRDVPLPDPR